MAAQTSSLRCLPRSRCHRSRADGSGIAYRRQGGGAAWLLVVGGGFLVTGFSSWAARRLAGARAEPTVGVAVGIGFAQGLAAVFRGVSRSGSTVCAALWGGLGPAAAAEFSFLLAIPVRSEEHTSELQSRLHLVCRLLLEKKKKTTPPCQSQSAAVHVTQPIL